MKKSKLKAIIITVSSVLVLLILLTILYIHLTYGIYIFKYTEILDHLGRENIVHVSSGENFIDITVDTDFLRGENYTDNMLKHLSSFDEFINSKEEYKNTKISIQYDANDNMPLELSSEVRFQNYSFSGLREIDDNMYSEHDGERYDDFSCVFLPDNANLSLEQLVANGYGDMKEIILCNDHNDLIAEIPEYTQLKQLYFWHSIDGKLYDEISNCPVVQCKCGVRYY